MELPRGVGSGEWIWSNSNHAVLEIMGEDEMVIYTLVVFSYFEENKVYNRQP